jgi:Zn-dependent peptidase ImmA (M78 family)
VAPGNGGPAVVVNTWDRISVERWIFTAAHELGHILLHREAYHRSMANEEEQEEKEADRFASHFLMPEESFESEWAQTRGLPLIARVLIVKRIYRVSYKTVLYRLHEHGERNVCHRSVGWAVCRQQHPFQGLNPGPRSGADGRVQSVRWSQPTLNPSNAPGSESPPWSAPFSSSQ